MTVMQTSEVRENLRGLILILLTWRIWRAPNNASRWQMGFNSAFKGLILTINLICGK